MRNQQKIPLASPIAAEIAMRHRMEELVTGHFSFDRFSFDQL
jgi:hypothetical protein